MRTLVTRGYNAQTAQVPLTKLTFQNTTATQKKEIQPALCPDKSTLHVAVRVCNCLRQHIDLTSTSENPISGGVVV